MFLKQFYRFKTPDPLPWTASRVLLAVVRFLLPALIVIVVTQLVHRSPLTNPAAGILAMGTILICSWFGGLGPALLMAPIIFVVSRIGGDDPSQWYTVRPQEWLAIAIIETLSAAVGLAGQYRRRLRAITEKNAQELRDQARALDQAPILFRDIEGRITQWNQGAQRLFGWTADEATGRISQELLATQTDRPLEEIEHELLQAGHWIGELAYQHKDGGQLQVVTHWILYRNNAGHAIGIAEFFNDVTSLRKAEAEIREADRRKDEFLAILAHELRNPLAPIRTGLELMRLVADDPEVIEETRGIMERQIQQLIALVDDLLDVSRISRGKLQLRRDQVELASIIRSAVEASKPTIDEAEHEFELELPSKPIYLDADPNRLAQVLSNLLDNAAKYTPRGGRIVLTCHQADDRVVVSIRDNGIGIPGEMLQQVFELFARTERSTKIVHSGLGIGLALAKSIVEMHGGRIEVASDGPDLGSEFRVVLPVQEIATQPTESDADSPEPGQKKVLIVDDNEAAAHLLSKMVKTIGSEVRVAHDGLEAIEVADRFRPDVILMDLGMPKLDGYEAARRLRSQPWGHAILLVALTGWGQDGHRQRTQEAGFDHHLVKPADPAEIRRLLADAPVPPVEGAVTAPLPE